MFGGYVGAISSVPETACLTVHKLDSFQGISIKFKNEFSIDENKENDFRLFLENNKLDKYVEQTNIHEWRCTQQDEISPDYKILDTKRFLENVNNYINVIDKIYWCHKRMNADADVLDFLEVYDLPGFGGTDAHEEIIKSIIEEESFDIIIYLLDPSQGIPKDSDIEKLRLLAPSIDKGNSDVLFYWAYEKPSEDFDKVEKLDEIRDSINGKLTNNFYKNARLLDMTGEKDDYELPQNVIASEVLSIYFQYTGYRYLKSQKEIWEWERKNNLSYKLPPILNQIDDESRKEIVSKERVKVIFQESLELEPDFLKKQTIDIQRICGDIKKKIVRDKTISVEELSEDEQKQLYSLSLKKEINAIINSMINFICHGVVNPIADINRVRKPFWEKYHKTREWKLLLQKLKQYKIMENFESVRESNLVDIGKDVFFDIKNNINEIEKYIKKNLPKIDSYAWKNDENSEIVSVSDSLARIIPEEDLLVIRSSEINTQEKSRMISDDLHEVGVEMDKRQFDAEKAITDNSIHLEDAVNKLGDVVNETQNLDNELSNLGM